MASFITTEFTLIDIAKAKILHTCEQIRIAF